jgi:hypothetical protein
MARLIVVNSHIKHSIFLLKQIQLNLYYSFHLILRFTYFVMIPLKSLLNSFRSSFSTLFQTLTATGAHNLGQLSSPIFYHSLCQSLTQLYTDT